MKLTVEGLIVACGDDSFESGLLIDAMLEPLAGRGAPVKPAVYAGNVYQKDTRWYRDEHLPVVVIDNVPSQANRLEAALEHVAARVGLPEVVLDLGEIEHLPPHLPRSLTGFRFPHRSADAYLRDALLDGEAFARTAPGNAILSATADAPQALFEWFPQALLFGFWVSHAGKKASQAKLARSWVSEIVGIDPGTTDTTVQGLKGDPLNLNTDNSVVYDPNFVDGWQYAEEKKAAGSKKKESLSEIGHGQVPVGDTRRRSRSGRSASGPPSRLPPSAGCGPARPRPTPPGGLCSWRWGSWPMSGRLAGRSACGPGASCARCRRRGPGSERRLKGTSPSMCHRSTKPSSCCTAAVRRPVRPVCPSANRGVAPASS